MKKILRGIALAVVALFLVVIPVLAYYYASLTVTESNGNSYTELPVIVSINTTELINSHYITANGTDTRVATAAGQVLPHLLTNDKLLFCANITASTTTHLQFVTGQTPMDSFPIITGYGGNVTVYDDDNIEPGDMYIFGIVCYLESDSIPIYKDGAVSLEVSGGDLVFSVVGGNSLTASGVSFGVVTIMVYCDGSEMWMTIDDVEQNRTSASAIPDEDSDWILFENVPYVYYYGEWLVT